MVFVLGLIQDSSSKGDFRIKIAPIQRFRKEGFHNM